MDPIIAPLILTAALFALLAAGIWVAITLLAVGWLGMVLFTGASAGPVLAITSWSETATWALTPLPLFIWMGEILFRTRLSQDLFRGLAPWLAYLPGRLVHVNIIGSAIFAAVSGSSAATAATIGKMSLPELRKRGYDESISIGSLAGAATLGILIPPSIIFIVYGVSAEISIARLFMAGVFPGIMLVFLFMGYIIVWAFFHPTGVPQGDTQRMTWREKIIESSGLIPIMILILAVLGSIYAGLATATEAAALGVVGSLLLSLLSGTLSRQTFVDSLVGAIRLSCMIGFILVGAGFLTKMMSFTDMPRLLAEWIQTLELSRYGLLAALTAFFMLLGCFLDGVSIVVLTTAVIMPMISKAGIDPIWFGVFLVITVEMAQVTPPVGFNLFVLQGLTGRNIFYIAKTAIPFFIVLLSAVVLITVFPEIVTWLPNHMYEAK